MPTKTTSSGIQWIGEIPAEWKMRRAKYLFSQRDGGAWGDEEAGNLNDYICIRIADFDYQKFTVNFDSEFTVRNYNKQTINSLLLKQGDILVEKSGGGEKTPVGRTIIFTGGFNAVYANFMDRLRVSSEVTSMYIQYMFVAMYQNDITKLYIKQTTGIQNLSLTELLDRECFPVPILTEQKSIVDYLNKQCERIETIVAEMERQVDIIRQYKKSLITETVTKGLDASALMKDSRIEWIGQIPASWDEKRLQVVSYIRARLGWKGLTADEYVDEGYAFLSAFNVIDDMLDLSDLNYINQFRYDESPEIKLRPGDIILVKDGAGLGKCARIDTLPFEATANGSLAVITTGDSLEYRYLYYYFVGDVFQQFIDRLKNGMGVPHLPQGYLRKIQVPIPPLHEQKAICDYLDERCAVVNVLIAEKQKSIETMRQYKKSLIYEYVTGKKRVKEVTSCQ